MGKYAYVPLRVSIAWLNVIREQELAEQKVSAGKGGRDTFNMIADIWFQLGKKVLIGGRGRNSRVISASIPLELMPEFEELAAKKGMLLSSYIKWRLLRNAYARLQDRYGLFPWQFNEAIPPVLPANSGSLHYERDKNEG